jgi:formylglycine-generating enzyme required for sulfatase activity
MGTLAVALFLAVDFQKQIAPVFEQSCLACHGPTQTAGGLRLDSAAGAAKAIRPGQPDASPLYTRTQIAPGKAGAMPPAGPPLTAEQGAALKQWIAEGANWPAGFVIASRKAAKAPDDLALVEKLRERLTPAGEFTAYRQTIPGTDVTYNMTPIPAGEFTMSGRQVKLDAFWIATHEVTWDEYRLFMFPKDPKDDLVDAVSRPTRPYVEMSFGMGLNGFPAISMTQHAANKYAQWLSARTGHYYRLPTEAEWEYACRAGTAEGATGASLGEYAWFADNSSDKYQKVGAKKPNAWGLYDMQGNVMEWSLDAFAPLTPTPGLVVNPWTPSSQPYPHAVRGGGWMSDASQCLCTSRVGSDASWKMQDPQLPKSIWYLTDAQWLGFRLVRPRELPSAAQMHKMWNNGVERE